MRNRYKTDEENEEQKRRLRYTLQDRRSICEVHPNVEKIVIEYHVEHRSAFGINEDSCQVIYEQHQFNVFEVDCLNRECTCGYFNLKDVVWNMIQDKKTTCSGKISCKGSEAPDHLYQSCGGSLEYCISITYK